VYIVTKIIYIIFFYSHSHTNEQALIGAIPFSLFSGFAPSRKHRGFKILPLKIGIILGLDENAV
jgi:hypothetical protein